MTTIALVGNPNSGKSTLFNALTKSHQRIGNWPGVTTEKKFGQYKFRDRNFDVIDLPGLYSLDQGDGSIGEDERIVRDFLKEHDADVIVNVVDATSLERGLFLTSQLREQDIPVVLALTMVDVAKKTQVAVDTDALSESFKCPVVPINARRRSGMHEMLQVICDVQTQPATKLDSEESRYSFVDNAIQASVTRNETRRNISDLIDKVVLNRILAFPIFLGVMYLMFFLSINVGSAFIDMFDILGSAFFVEGPRQVLSAISTPDWLTALLADGVGGGIQLVGTFIPVIASLFLFLTILEDTGYMGRAAFILDRPLRHLGIPGKSFIPLVVGFGCNVPAVMATRSLDSRPDRILTTIMAPFMSCGARLTVYALFAAAFFPSNGQNVVFALYLFGIFIAIGSAWLVRKHLLADSTGSFTQELPAYHIPTIRGIFTHTWHRLKGFVLRAGRAIVLVVIALNVVSSIGTDGTFGNENKEKSVLAEIGRTITPLFRPMGISDDNWPATVGIFTGMFAKEVVVGTLDALYTPVTDDDDDFNLGEQIAAAFVSVPDNLSQITEDLADPLGITLDESTNVAEASVQHEVEINTIQAMQSLFDGKLGAFSYLIFILLYMPCVATIGVIYKELGTFWAGFSTAWSVVIAYASAVTCYQLGMVASQPVSSLITLFLVILFAVGMFSLLVFWGRRRAPAQDRLLEVTNLQ